MDLNHLPATAYAGVGTVIGALVALAGSTLATRASLKSQRELFTADLRRHREDRYFEKRASVYAELIDRLLQVQAVTSYTNSPDKWKYRWISNLAEDVDKTIKWRGSIHAFGSDGLLPFWERYARVAFPLRDEARRVLKDVLGAGSMSVGQAGGFQMKFQGLPDSAFDVLPTQPIEELLKLAEATRDPAKALIRATRLELQGKTLKVPKAAT